MGDKPASSQERADEGREGIPGAEKLYERYLERRAAGEKLDFETFCREYPQRRVALECLHLLREESKGDENA